MLRRLTLGLFTLACAAAVAACSSGNTTPPSTGGVPGIGPNFPTNTIYVSDTTQNAIEIYSPSPSPSATPQFLIGGSSTSLDGPAYLAFDSGKNLYVTNFGASSKQGSITIYKEFATGNVVAFGSASLGAEQPRGIAMIPSDGGFVVAFTQQPGGFFQNGINVYAPFKGPGGAFLSTVIAGSNTNLNVPIGVAVDANKNVYTANSGDGKIRVYALPSPSPTPSGSPTASPSPTPTPTTAPSGAPSASPSPTPTPSSDNIAPIATISCVPSGGMPSPCMTRPNGMTLDGSGNVYVTDPDSGVSPAIYIFTAAQVACAAPPCSLSLTPSRFLAGSSTGLVNPTDVAVDSAGTIYVVDGGSGPNSSKLLIFDPAASGNVAPKTSIALPQGSATGLALSP